MKLRFNGTGPAWPRLLGTEHPFYASASSSELGSTSYSLLGDNHEWEILIDAGHNTVPFLLQNGNRLPDAVFFTHGHADHILGFDWIAQSQRFSKNDRKLPVYCTALVFESIMNHYGHCKNYIEFRELSFAETFCIPEAGNVKLTAYPVYHGPSAHGASSLFFQELDNSVLFTGDLFCPLYRKKDYESISNASLMVIDTNSRFPNPNTNHTSFTSNNPDSLDISSLLSQWINTNEISLLLEPQLLGQRAETEASYFEEFSNDFNSVEELPLSIIDLVRRTRIPKVYLVHYSGIFDDINYKQKFMTAKELEDWANHTAKKSSILQSEFFVPKVGEYIRINKNI